MTTRVSDIASIAHDHPHPRRIRTLGIIGMLISISLKIGTAQPGQAGGANDTFGSDTFLRQRIDKINSVMNSFAEQYVAKLITPQSDNGVQSENQDVFNTGYFAANEHGYYYVIPAYWLWHYAIPAADANLPKDRKPLTWLL